MEFRPATPSDLDAVDALVAECTRALTAQGILQWDERYPNRAFFEEAVAGAALHALVVQGRIIGAVVLDEWQPPEWQAVQWQQHEHPALVIYAFAIHPADQGRGYGTALLRACETYAVTKGYTSIRLDAFSGNLIARRLYEQRGYIYRGMVYFTSKPAGQECYYCYEKFPLNS